MKERKEKKRWGLIVFLIFIMIGTSFSFIFFGFSPQSETVKYNGIKFVKNPLQNIWIAKVNGKEAPFSFLPNEVENIGLPENAASRLQNKFEIDATYDLNSSHKEVIALAQHQMGMTLNAYGIYVRKGFTSNSTFNLPIITCNDASANVPVVYFRQGGNATNIRLEDNCIIAEASKDADFIRMKDRLLYGMLGVIG